MGWVRDGYHGLISLIIWNLNTKRKKLHIKSNSRSSESSIYFQNINQKSILSEIKRTAEAIRNSCRIKLHSKTRKKQERIIRASVFKGWGRLKSCLNIHRPADQSWTEISYVTYFGTIYGPELKLFNNQYYPSKQKNCAIVIGTGLDYWRKWN